MGCWPGVSWYVHIGLTSAASWAKGWPCPKLRGGGLAGL